MTTNKPGSVNQQPLYGCTNCYEDWTWPAGDLRVHDSECWCDPCWDERRWEFPDQPCWNDLEPYTPALQAECEQLRKDAERYRWLRNNCATVFYDYGVDDKLRFETYRPDGLDSAIDAAMKGEHQ